MFDHTLVLAEDDPWLEAFKQMETAGVAQIRILPNVGAEKFAEYVFNKVNDFVQLETDGRVKVIKVEFREHNKNSASYVE
jgi:6-pyruvoyltetrahydropterin/6-carboxytetrahydropterin synthase